MTLIQKINERGQTEQFQFMIVDVKQYRLTRNTRGGLRMAVRALNRGRDDIYQRLLNRIF